MYKNTITLLLLFLAISSYAGTYRCTPETQSIFGKNNKDFIDTAKPYSIIEDEREPMLHRCSYVASRNGNVCDAYKVDKVEIDKFVNIKKFYVFRSQFDIQLFSELSYVENNGRGGILFGKCELVKP